MKRTCAVCRESFETKRSNAKFCGDMCRQRAHRGAPTKGRDEPPVPDVDGPLTRSTRAELVAVDRVESAKGQAAIIAAQVIDSKQNVGSALSALLREWRVTLDAATVGARVLASPRDRAVDELEARRAQRGA